MTMLREFQNTKLKMAVAGLPDPHLFWLFLLGGGF
jgi:hypothetical protein